MRHRRDCRRRRTRRGRRARVPRMRDVIAHRGPDDAGSVVRRAGGARPPPPEHRRSAPPASSRCRTRTARSGSSSTARSTTTPTSARELEAARPPLPHAVATPKRSSTPTSSGATTASTASAACSRSRSGTRRRRRLLLARDRLGVKPLYWARAGDRLLFGSEIKAILASGLVEPRGRTRRRCRSCSSTRYLSGDRDAVQGHPQAAARAHRWSSSDGDVRIAAVLGRAGRHADAGRDRRRRTRDVVARFRELLEESVRLRLMSDVPLGMFLSGGIDSSAIAALMARMIDRPLQTFSVAFKERAFSELDYARAGRARRSAPTRTRSSSTTSDFFGALPRLVWHEDEPIAHPSSVPLYFVSALARQHVKVVLTGEGSDELLAGYGKYPRALVELARRRGLRAAVPGAAARRGRRRGRAAAARPRRPLRARARSSPCRARRRRCSSTTSPAIRLARAAALLLAAARAALATRERAYGAVARATSTAERRRSTLLDRLLYADIKTYLRRAADEAGPDEHGGVDREPRAVPRSQARRVRGARCPTNGSCRGFTTKRDPARGDEGRAARRRSSTRPKMGFPVPFARWMRGGWNSVARDVLLDRRSARARHHRRRARSSGCSRDHAAGATDGGDAHLEPAQPRALVPHVHRRRRRADAAGSPDRPPRRRRSAHDRQPIVERLPDMRILWLKSDLLLPLDKGGKLRTWHLMRHLAHAPRDHLPVVRRSAISRRRTVEGMREVCASS